MKVNVAVQQNTFISQLERMSSAELVDELLAEKRKQLAELRATNQADSTKV